MLRPDGTPHWQWPPADLGSTIGPKSGWYFIDVEGLERQLVAEAVVVFVGDDSRGIIVSNGDLMSKTPMKMKIREWLYADPWVWISKGRPTTLQ